MWWCVLCVFCSITFLISFDYNEPYFTRVSRPFSIFGVERENLLIVKWSVDLSVHHPLSTNPPLVVCSCADNTEAWFILLLATAHATSNTSLHEDSCFGTTAENLVPGMEFHFILHIYSQWWIWEICLWLCACVHPQLCVSVCVSVFFFHLFHWSSC